MKNYFCQYCSTVVQENSRPSGSGCSQNSSNGHLWHDLGNVGNDNYHCKVCGVVVKSDGRPSGHGCPKSTGSGHRWDKR